MTVLIKSSSTFKQFLHVTISKQKKVVSNEKKRDEHRDKIARIMLTLIIQDLHEINIIEWVQFAEVSNKFNKEFVDKLVICESENYKKTINNSIWEKLWLKVIQVELIALIANKIWEAVVFFKDVNIVINKWIFKTKIHINGTLNKFKARLVVRKFSQMYNIDYTKIFASIIKFDILYLFLIILTLQDLKNS